MAASMCAALARAVGSTAKTHDGANNVAVSARVNRTCINAWNTPRTMLNGNSVFIPKNRLGGVMPFLTRTFVTRFVMAG